MKPKLKNFANEISKSLYGEDEPWVY